MLELSRLHCLGEALRDALMTYKSNSALFEADRHRQTLAMTYRELLLAAEHFGASLQAGGLQAGGRVALLMSNQSKWVISSHAAHFCGAVLVPLDYKLSASEQHALLSHCRPHALVTEYPIWRELSEHAPGLAHGMRVVVSEVPDDVALDGAERWPAATEHDAARVRHVMRSREDVAAIVYSSGTGGTPKGCVLTHDNYLEQAQVLGRMFPMEEDDRYLSLLPTNHAIDFMCGTVLPFFFGAAVVHQRTLRAEFLAPTMRRYRVTHSAMVPRILKALREKIEEQLDTLPDFKRVMVDSLIGINDLATQRKPNHRLSRALLKPIHDHFGGRLRTIVAGGAFVDPALATFFYRLGFPIAIGYGLTEACMVLTVNDLSPFRADSVGSPVEGVELQLREQNEHGVGEVYVRGRTVMQGYLDEPDLSAEVLCDGWLRTGDLGVLDASGHLRLFGRRKNMIVTEGGKNVYPEDIEHAFQHVECEELCVFAASYVWTAESPVRSGGERVGEQLTLVVRAKKDQSKAALRAALAQANRALVDYKRVSSYVFWDREFPRTASMKVKREQLAAQLREETSEARTLQAS